MSTIATKRSRKCSFSYLANAILSVFTRRTQPPTTISENASNSAQCDTMSLDPTNPPTQPRLRSTVVHGHIDHSSILGPPGPGEAQERLKSGAEGEELSRQKSSGAREKFCAEGENAITATLQGAEAQSVALLQEPIFMDNSVADSDKETRLKRRKEARDKAREEANHNHHAPNIRPPIVTTIRAEDEELSLGPAFKLPAITVPLQKQYAGMHPVISSTQASITCTSLGVDGVLDLLNNVLRTAYTLDEPFLREHLKECIVNGHDFGMAYASLRPRWFDGFSELKAIMNNCRNEDEKLRREALDLDRGRITAQIRPRRVWDLFANRVVPIWVTRKFPWAIPHSWMEPNLRSSIRTPINASKWPVPFPIDSSLERVRIELLNLGAEYVWLDVLCFRQFGDAEYEALRKEEWLIDVPTIGGVYHQNQMIVCYYSGLGRPFRVGDVNHERHWLKRAWTLQEISLNSICAGETDDADSPSRASVKEDGHYDDQNIDLFYERLGSLSMFAQETDNIFPVLSAMLERFAVNLNDKVAGMAYLLRSRDVPVYVEGQSTEDAWDNLLRTMNSRYLGDLLFLYPYAGSPRHAWAPSWEQIKKEDLPASGGVYLYEQVEMKAYQVQSDGEDPKTESRSIARHRGYRIMECKIEGLSNNIESLSKSKPRRDGYAVIGSHRFKVQALHKQTISEYDCLTMVAGEGLE